MPLLLTRRIGEKIVINKEIEITFLYRKGNQVCLSFDAPDDIEILRGEIYEKRLAEQSVETG